MTVPNEILRAGPYVVTGGVRRFPFAFPVLSDQELRVYVRDALNVDRVYAKTDYQVEGVGNPNGGTVVFGEPAVPPFGGRLFIDRDMPFTQQTDLVNQGPYYAEVVESDFDRSVMRDQQLLRMIRDLQALLDGTTGRAVGFVLRGPWQRSTTYDIGDVVSFDGSSYVTPVDHVSGASDFGTDFAVGRWLLFARGGQNGKDGEDGSPGGKGDPGTAGQTPQLRVQAGVLQTRVGTGAWTNLATVVVQAHFLFSVEGPLPEPTTSDTVQRIVASADCVVDDLSTIAALGRATSGSVAVQIGVVSANGLDGGTIATITFGQGVPDVSPGPAFPATIAKGEGIRLTTPLGTEDLPFFSIDVVARRV